MLIKKILLKLDKPKTYNIKNYIRCDKSLASKLCKKSVMVWSESMTNVEIRKQLIKGGEKMGKKFLKSFKTTINKGF